MAALDCLEIVHDDLTIIVDDPMSTVHLPNLDILVEIYVQNLGREGGDFYEEDTEPSAGSSSEWDKNMITAVTGQSG